MEDHTNKNKKCVFSHLLTLMRLKKRTKQKHFAWNTEQLCADCIKDSNLATDRLAKPTSNTSSILDSPRSGSIRLKWTLKMCLWKKMGWVRLSNQSQSMEKTPKTQCMMTLVKDSQRSMHHVNHVGPRCRCRNTRLNYGLKQNNFLNLAKWKIEFTQIHSHSYHKLWEAVNFSGRCRAKRCKRVIIHQARNFVGQRRLWWVRVGSGI